MNDKEVSDYWLVDVTQSSRLKVVFDREVTRDEVTKLVLDEAWEDIMDVNDTMIVDVHDAKPISFGII